MKPEIINCPIICKTVSVRVNLKFSKHREKKLTRLIGQRQDFKKFSLKISLKKEK